MDSKDIGSEQQQLRTAGEAGWHVSRYNLMAPVPDGDGVVIYNTFKRSCGEYNPIEVFLLSAVEKLDEDHPAIALFAKRGVIANFDEREALVQRRAEETGNRIEFYVASLVDVSPADEPDSRMADYAYHGIEVSLRPENRHVPVGVDHCCVAQNLWLVAIDDAGYLYKCGGKLCGQPEYAYATARDWDPADPLATASNSDMLSRFLNTCNPEPGDMCYECAWLPLCGGGCPQLRLFGKRKCPPYKYDPEAFVLAMHARRDRNGK